jgi:hypothetical protein
MVIDVLVFKELDQFIKQILMPCMKSGEVADDESLQLRIVLRCVVGTEGANTLGILSPSIRTQKHSGLCRIPLVLALV